MYNEQFSGENMLFSTTFSHEIHIHYLCVVKKPSKNILSLANILMMIKLQL